jgi:hypothetical protein
MKSKRVLGRHHHLLSAISRRDRRDLMPECSMACIRRCIAAAGHFSSSGDEPLVGGEASSSDGGCRKGRPSWRLNRGPHAGQRSRRRRPRTLCDPLEGALEEELHSTTKAGSDAEQGGKLRCRFPPRHHGRSGKKAARSSTSNNTGDEDKIPLPEPEHRSSTPPRHHGRQGEKQQGPLLLRFGPPPLLGKTAPPSPQPPSSHRSRGAASSSPKVAWIGRRRSKLPPSLQDKRPNTGNMPKTERKPKDLQLIYSGAKPRPAPASYSGGAAVDGPVNGGGGGKVL